MSTRPGFLCGLCGVLLVITGYGCTNAPSKPNVIWILLDACRAQNLSCYGYARKTSPNIDKLAARGVVFEQCFCQGPETVESVPSFMTGRYFPVQCLGVGDWKEMWRTLPAAEMLFPEILRQNGYYTAMITCHPWFTPESRIWEKFDEVHFVRMSRPDSVYAEFGEVNQHVIPWLYESREKPFFLYVHVMDTHFPHDLRPPYNKWLPVEVTGYQAPFSQEEKEFLRGLYDGSMLYADERIGVIVETLSSLGLLRNTIIIIGSDHGDMLGEDGKTTGHLGSTYDEILQVPLIMAGPGLPRGRRVSSFAENTDIVPTLVELLELETTATMHGKSQLPVIRETHHGSVRDDVVSTLPGRDDDHPGRFVLRNATHKYEWDPHRGTEFLWAVPDSGANRRDLLKEHPEVAAEMRAEIQRRFMPLWEEYAALPRTSPRAFTVPLPGKAQPPDAYVSRAEGTETDNKWSLGEEFVQAAGFKESPPPITFHMTVPNGLFRVNLGIGSGVLQNGTPRNVVAVKAQDDQEFSMVHSSDSGIRMEYVDLGEYLVTEDSFVVTLAIGSPQAWAHANSLRFIPSSLYSDRSLSPEAEAEREEQLRALGYLGD